jgi:Transposase DDE domain group 1
MDCPANPRPLAVRAHPAASGLRLCARGADGLVRGQPRRLSVRACPQRPPGRHDRRAAAEKSGRPARRFKDFQWSTLDTWSRRRRVVAKAEWTQGEANPRFVVTSLKRAEAGARQLYEDIYCARGEMENRIKECQLDLYADRTSAATMRANQLRLWFASMAYVLICALRRVGLAETTFADATCGTIRLKLLKIGARVRISVRRIKIAMASACPAAQEWGHAARRLTEAAKARASPA